MERKILSFKDIAERDFNLVGGKGYNLGRMSQEGLPVPDGFCVTTGAYKKHICKIENHDVWRRLQKIDHEDVQAVRKIGKEIRTVIKMEEVSDDIRAIIIEELKKSGEEKNYAVRSSATAEDLPSMSFAGQQDTYLNIKGVDSIIESIKSCWASLYTDRAIMYRGKNNIPHEEVLMSVVVQEMVGSKISGIMFTADPLTESRDIISIDASYGLGEALVSGLVVPDVYKWRKSNSSVIEKVISPKTIELVSSDDGGTVKRNVSGHMKNAQALSDSDIEKLALMGEKIEKYYGEPQDIEWAVDDGGDIFITQSRPITSLFPILDESAEGFRVYISFNYVQVMMNALKPLGTSFIKMMIPLKREGGNTYGDSTLVKEKNGRVYIDLTDILATPIGKNMVPKVLNNIDVQMSQALAGVVERGDLKGSAGELKVSGVMKVAGRIGPRVIRNFIGSTKGKIQKADMIIAEYTEAFKEELYQAQTSEERIGLIRKNITGYMPPVFTNLITMIIPGLISYGKLRKMCRESLGSDELAQKLAQGLVGNVTTEMGLEMGDIAELFRDNKELMDMLNKVNYSEIIGKLSSHEDDSISRPIKDFMRRNGARGIGEIDITSERWFEDSTPLVQSIVNHLNIHDKNEHRLKYEKLVEEGERAGEELIEKLGKNIIKKKIVTKLVDNVRNLMPIREHGKYGIIQCFGIAKKCLLEEGEKMEALGLIESCKDIYFLNMHEIEQCIREKRNIEHIVSERKDQFERIKDIRPHRVVTSSGEILRGMDENKDLPEGTIVGNPVSAGTIEGVARVVMNPDDAVLEKGEILVAPFTDPGWTPLFVNAEGLVLEVGGLLTHGAVVAREYGMPAVVGVDGATEKIRTGDRIRVDGNTGYITIL